jgi:REP element-mobilizing transposase RayT
MSRFKKLSYTIYECKYHVVCCPKYRHRIFKGEIGEYARQQIYGLCKQKEGGTGTEYTVRPFTSCDVDAAEICSIGDNGICERETIAEIISKV